MGATTAGPGLKKTIEPPSMDDRAWTVRPPTAAPYGRPTTEQFVCQDASFSRVCPPGGCTEGSSSCCALWRRLQAAQSPFAEAALGAELRRACSRFEPLGR
jgi:hypothetical protein